MALADQIGKSIPYMFQDISEKITPLLKKNGLDKHVARAWTYRDLCQVYDFVYQDVRFAFEIMPLADDLFRLTIVERNHTTGFVVTQAANKKAVLAERTSLKDAAELLRLRAEHLFSEIDAHTDHSVADIAADTTSAVLARVTTGKKTVGVMTLPLNANYGGNLQAFALMQALRKLGHAPILINSRHPTRTAPAIASGEGQPLMAKTAGLGDEVANNSFIDTYLQPITRPFNSAADLAKHVAPLGLDAVVAGSDQVWRPKFARSLLTNFYFFGFLPEDSKVRRISYAASFGVPNWEFSEEQSARAAQLIRRFDGASVREDEAVNLCREHLGVVPKHVLDPTLLMTPDDYRPVLAEAPRQSKPGQLLTYLLDVTVDKVSAVDRLSKALSLQAHSTNGLAFPPAEDADASGEDKTVQGWLAAFHDAAFIVTDSFH
ncbi:MAG: polysaccharide pyruvyl transferase family protein, partial [Pseudomonadota bacterium]|nr:polysaccharide pyruvyl transferase family protein [Pseudomonadota bacterium]